MERSLELSFDMGNLNLVVLFMAMVSAVSSDCQNVINLALGMRMDVKQPSIMSKLRTDCCSASSVSYSPYVDCNTNQRVTDIDWSMMDLDGVFNGTALPSLLRTITVSQNSLVGPLPKSYPSSLFYMSVRGNSMGGDVPLFPDTLTEIRLGRNGSPGNHFTGRLYITGPIEYLQINDNWITDVVILDTSQLGSCDLSNNPLLGNPNIANLGICTRNDLYSANLLPKTLSTFVSTSTRKIGFFSTFFSITFPSISATHSIPATSKLSDFQTSGRPTVSTTSETEFLPNYSEFATTRLNSIFLDIPITSVFQLEAAFDSRSLPYENISETILNTESLEFSTTISSFATALFRPNRLVNEFTFQMLLKSIFKVAIDIFLLVAVFLVTPLRREIFAKFRKEKKENVFSSGDFQ